jgi:sugar lactone lactonase YvrE
MSAPVGFALPAAGGAFVAGIGRTLTRLADFDAAGEPLGEVEPQHTENRFNDAACDPRGRLWAGTMSTTRAPGTAALYRIEAGGAPEVAIGGATISNGLDWNLDATRLYYVDSPTQRIDVIDFDVDRGRLGERRPFVRIDPADGLPDGLTVDAEGGVWIALFGGGAIRRYTPDGELDAHIALPVTNPTSPAFGGPNRDELFVTSARHRLTPAQRAREPLAGSLLRLRPGVSGRAANVFGAG